MKSKKENLIKVESRLVVTGAYRDEGRNIYKKVDQQVPTSTSDSQAEEMNFWVFFFKVGNV